MLKSLIWVEQFGAEPPRGSLARLCRRIGASVHESHGKHGWRSKGELRREVLRLKRWYKPGRRESRVRWGIRRGYGASSETRGRHSVWTAKVNQHVRRLVSKRRLRGLWLWRTVALALREAGMTVQTGTVPVERLWAQFKAAFPSASRRMSLGWWKLLAALCFMRFN